MTRQKQTVIVFIILLLLVSIIPQAYKEYFVQPTGNIKIIGLGFGLILSAAIYFKWKYAQGLFYLIFIPVMLFDFFILTKVQGIYFMNYTILTACHVGLFIIFRFSKNINSYLKK